MSADLTKAEGGAEPSAPAAGEEQMFDDQGAPIGPGALQESGGSAAADLAAVTPITVADQSSATPADEVPEAAQGAEGETDAEASAPPPPANETTPQLTIAQLKEKIMATAPINDDMKQTADTLTASVTDAMNEAQSRAKAAYDKGTQAVGDMTEFAKGNVEAVVESSKIIASGMQEIGRSYAEEAKAAYEQMTADLKELAAVKSPTELFQLQGKIMRRNFDTLVAASSKNSEAMMKLANEAFAPLSGRMNAAAEKISKVG